MKREKIVPRKNWQNRVEQEIGFGFHSIDNTYWDESACYSFTLKEVDQIEIATGKLFDMFLEAIQYVIDNDLFSLFNVRPDFIPYITKSWNDEYPSLYGRFDLAYNDGEIKLLEFNADTPTSLFEGAIVQWHWLKDVKNSETDQFNSMHEQLIDTFKYLAPWLKPGKLHFACIKNTLEDLTTIEYLRDCAMQAGLDTSFIHIEDIGWDEKNMMFVDLDNKDITNIFKLYPWEWIQEDKFALNVIKDKTYWIEPAWRCLATNKTILAILWKLFPYNQYLLPAYLDKDYTEGMLPNRIIKPKLGREGANVTIFSGDNIIEQTGGVYGKEGFVVQEYYDIPAFDGMKPVIGSWIIGLKPCGMGIRESETNITNNLSRFIPHYISK